MLAMTEVQGSSAPAVPERLTTGELIAPGRRLVRRLGGGERYEAFAAWDDRLHALVVVKALRTRLIDDPRARAALAREADALAALRHPDLVRSFGEVQDGPRPHLVLEFLDGPRLSTLVRRYGPLSPEQSVLLGRRLASVLAYFATAGWVHLDIKPRNVIMTATPRVIDLSVARPVDDARGRSGIGTAAYMAPEQCDPTRADTIGPASDVWGLGATLYEAVSGAQAFPRRPDGPRFTQLTRPPEPLPARVAPPLADLILDCLADRPEDRPTAVEIHDTLESLADWADRSVRRIHGVR